MDINKVRNNILNEAKPYVVKYGWNENLLDQILKKSKYKKTEIASLFPEGYISLLQIYLDQINTKMTNESQYINLIRLKTHERIRDICILRFTIMSKEKKLISKTFFHLLLPNNFNFCLMNLHKTIDQIWYLAGDNSSDFNYYSKRVILASIYSSTLVHFINNSNFNKTIELLNKQLKKVAKIPKIKNQFHDLKKLIPQILKFKEIFNFTKQ